jgi:two-component system copper resistance phosphate regulon response regulator CusR
MRLLVVENDSALGTFLKRGFEAENYDTDLISSGEDAKRAAAQLEYGAAILDVNMREPGVLDVLRHLRGIHPHLPILILTVRTRPEERAQMLDLGADDIVLKPFALSELCARVRALLRRGTRLPETVLRVEDLELSLVEHRAKRAGRVLDLTPKEFALLEYLMRNSGKHVTRAEIIEHVWNLSFDTMTNVVDVYINYASAQVDKRKVGKLAMAIQEGFSQMGVFEGSGAKPAMLTPEEPGSNVPVIENRETLRALGNPSPDSTRGAHLELDEAQKQMELALAPEIKTRSVSVTSTKEGMVVSLRELGFFASGSTALQPSALAVLDQFVKVAGPLHTRIRIEGHTDNVPIHNGRFDSNWELSTARATEIIKLFITNYGMAPDRLSASGYGEYYPVASNDTPQGRAMNRRVDLVILNSTADSSAPSPADTAPLPPQQATTP